MRSTPLVRATIASAVWLACLAIYFRLPLLSGFAYSFGDRGDATIELSILEHWRNVWIGASPWWQTFYFHPHPATLGYNDGYFLSGVIYTLARIVADPVVAVLLMAAVYRSIAFWSCLWLLSRFAGAHWQWALTGAAIFTIGNTQYLQAIHGQFQAQALLPILAGTAWQAIRYARANELRMATVLGASFSALLGVLLCTSFYLGWFLLLFSSLLIATSAIELKGLTPLERRKLLRQVRMPILAAIAVLLTAATPIFWLYLPKLAETGGYSGPAVHYYLVEIPDLLSPGKGNWLWGFMQDWTWSFSSDLIRNADLEFWVGQPLLFLSLSVGAIVLLFFGERKTLSRDFPFLFPLATSIILSFLMTLDIGNQSPWNIAFLFPGSAGIRVVSRFHLFLVLPIIVLISVVFRRYINDLWQRNIFIAGSLSLLLIIEQGNSENVAKLEREAVEQLLALPRPPDHCEAFSVISSRPNESEFHSPRINSLYPHNVDAMLLAEWWQLPTVNGFSTFNPPDWNFADPGAPDYRNRVLAYAASHGIGPICFLDTPQRPVWTRQLSQTL